MRFWGHQVFHFLFVLFAIALEPWLVYNACNYKKYVFVLRVNENINKRCFQVRALVKIFSAVFIRHIQ